LGNKGSMVAHWMSDSSSRRAMYESTEHYYKVQVLFLRWLLVAFEQSHQVLA